MEAGDPLYTPLEDDKAIRLIILEPADSHQPISVRLQAVRSPSHCEYDAISYTWGDSRLNKHITCNGRPLRITDSLHWSLSRVRHTHQHVVVWADAICINQDDPRERSHQVTLMGDIFSTARKVFLCMGMDLDGGAFNVQTLVHEVCPLVQGHRLDLLGGHQLRHDGRWFSMATFTRLSWFKRAWVIQEAGLARDPRVLYGAAEFGYRDFITVLRWVNTCEWAMKFGVSSLYIHLEWLDWTKMPPQPEYSFLDLLSHGALLSCSDPRDRVYAFLGHPLASDDDKRLIVAPDYEKHCNNVFLDLSKKLLRLVGLDALTTVEQTEQTLSEAFPSWVTRWDVSVVMNDILRRPNLLYAASRGLVQNIPETIHGNELSLQGVVVDTVCASYKLHINNGAIHFQKSNYRETLDLKQMMEKLERADNVSCVYADWAESFSRTLCAYPSEPNVRVLPYAARLAMALAQHKHATDGRQNVSWNLDSQTLAYGAKVDAFCQGRSFVITEKAYFGLAPAVALPGDVCCILFNVNVPFFLRPCGNGRFKLLGESYVHGIMEGQAKVMLMRGELNEETLTIC